MPGLYYWKRRVLLPSARRIKQTLSSLLLLCGRCTNFQGGSFFAVWITGCMSWKAAPILLARSYLLSQVMVVVSSIHLLCFASCDACLVSLLSTLLAVFIFWFFFFLILHNPKWLVLLLLSVSIWGRFLALSGTGRVFTFCCRTCRNSLPFSAHCSKFYHCYISH